MITEKFYDKGLKFECQRCSKCCRHDPGYVFLTKNDLKNLTSELDISEEIFLEKYCRIIEMGEFTRISLNEKKNFDCIFWQDGGCTVYKARPVQCRTYPFWINYLEEQSDWEALGNECPGVGKGVLIPKEEIEKRITERQKEVYLIGKNI